MYKLPCVYPQCSFGVNNQKGSLRDVLVIQARAKERMKNPIKNKKQKFPAGTRVYVRPMIESSMSHFQGDMITTVEGTYAQLYGGNNFKSYSLKCAAWYEEDQLMPANGMSLKKCRDNCLSYFGISYTDLIVRADEAKEKFNKFLQWD